MHELKSIALKMVHKKIEGFVDRKVFLKRLNRFCIAVTAMLFLVAIYEYVVIIIYPYQAEYREGAQLLLTHMLLNGEKPFTVASLPTAMSVYGIFYNLLVFPFAKIINQEGNLLLIHRLVVAISIFLSLYLIFNINRKNNCRILLNFELVTLLFIACFSLGVVFGTLLAEPAAVGLLLMLLSIYVVIEYNFSSKALLLSILLLLCAIFTKLYFGFGFLLISLYCFLFVSKLRGLLYVCVFSVCFFLVAKFTQSWLPLYFVNTYYNMVVHYGYMPEHIWDFLLPAPYVIEQLRYFLFHYCFIIIAALIVFCYVHGFFKKKHNINFKSIFSFKLNQPLFTIKCDFYLFATLLSLLIFYAQLGRNGAAWMEYLIQLNLPFLVLYIAKNEHCLNKKIYSLVNFLIIINLIWLFSISFKYKIGNFLMNSRHLGDWRYIESLVKDKKNVDIYATPAITSILMENNKKVYLSGLTTVAFYIPDALSKVGDKLFIPKQASVQVQNRLDAFQKDMLLKIRNQQFDLCIVDNEDMPFFKQINEELPKYYKVVKQLKLDMRPADQRPNIVVYIRK